VTVELRRAKQEREPGPRCPNCGTTYEEFRKRGRFGCQECYESFGPELDRLIKRVHGADQHRGKRPGARRRPQGAAGGGVAELRQALARAVAAEQYELAAELRDQMRALQEAAGTGDADGRSAGSEVR